MLRTVPWIVLAGLVSSSAAFAQEGTTPDWANKSGGIGVGGNATMGGTSGVNIRTYVTPQLGLSLTFGFQIASASNDETDTDFSTRVFEAGLNGSYKLAYWQRGHLSTILGLDVQTLSTSVEGGPIDEDFSNTDLIISLGLGGEYFPTQYLSLFMQTGLLIDFLGEDETGQITGGIDAVDEFVDGYSVSLFDGVEGSAGFTVWFK